MISERHWSTFEIDVAWAEGLPAHPELAAHLGECAECAAYVEQLRALDAMPVTAGRPKARTRWVTPVAASLALAAAVLLFLRHRPPSADEATGGYVGVKGGTPASMLLLKRGEATRPWDGREPIRPGDVVALHVACEGYRHVSVVAKDGARWVRVSETECPREPGILPFTLVVDERPGDEELGVVFTRATIGEGAASEAMASGAAPSESWVVRFVLPKETSR
jgi:hypothetical protein